MSLNRWNPLTRWRDRRAHQSKIDQIHGEIVAAARAPELYAVLGVPDDIDGRFEMIVVHAGLVLRRLGELGEPARPWAQDIVDRVFTGFEDALRELSISDVGVAKRMKAMASAFFGRIAVYHAALANENPEALAEALARNVYRGAVSGAEPAPRMLARRIFAGALALEGATLEAFTDGGFHFPRG
ncbi:MAG: ubiquinol-cytochrome C chaperone family protein [Roseiarcus sp.]